MGLLYFTSIPNLLEHQNTTCVGNTHAGNATCLAFHQINDATDLSSEVIRLLYAINTILGMYIFYVI